MVLEKILESPLDSKEIKPVNLKENQLEYLLEGLMHVLRVLEGNVALWGFRLKASRIVRNTFLVFSGTKFVVFCYCSPKKLTQCLLASWDCCEAQRGKIPTVL